MVKQRITFLSHEAPSANKGSVKHVESIYVGRGQTSVVVKEKWDHDFTLSRKKAPEYVSTSTREYYTDHSSENRTGVVDLDFSKFTGDLLFEIEDDKVSVFQAEPDGLGGLKRKADGASVVVNGHQKVLASGLPAINGVRNIIGGSGNNSYVFKNGGSISGYLKGGPDDQATGKRNILDYSDFGEAIKANLTDNTISFNSTPTATVEKPAAILPLQERWVYDVEHPAGRIATSLKIGLKLPAGGPLQDGDKFLLDSGDLSKGFAKLQKQLGKTLKTDRLQCRP